MKVGTSFGKSVFVGKRGGHWKLDKHGKRVYLSQHDRLLMLRPKDPQVRIMQLPSDLEEIVYDYKAQLEAPQNQVFCMLCTSKERVKVVTDFLTHYSGGHIHLLRQFALTAYRPTSRIHKKAVMASKHW